MTDLVLQRFIEVILSFPGILLAILIIFVTGSPGVASVVFALAATGWSGYARLVRGQVLSLRERGFVEATRILGLSTPRILVRHLLPSVAGPVGVLMTFQVASAILAEAGLSFLGLGPQDGSSWGGMLEQGAILFVKSPLIGMSAGLAIAVTVIGVNFLGDYLRDVLDPQSNG
jgi:peptide/nickel transport system permease protein